MNQPVIFIDKDGTLIDDVPYNVDPGQIRLAPGAAGALKRWAKSGAKLILVTNQPGIAEGRFAESALQAVETRIGQLLSENNISLGGFYYCPHSANDRCVCRKPQSGLLRRAAAELRIDLTGAWMIGDILDDLEAGKRLGCKTILINNGHETVWQIDSCLREPDFICADLEQAALITETCANRNRRRPRFQHGFVEWQNAQNILAVRLDAFGDVLMTSPALAALKCVRSGRRLTILTSRAGAEAAALIPAVDDIMVYEAPWMKSSEHRNSDAAADRALIDSLQNRRFDAAVIFTVYSQNPLPAALACFYADIPLRLAHCRENPYRLLTHVVEETEPQKEVRHEVARQLDLVAAIGAAAPDESLQVRIGRAAVARVHQWIEHKRLSHSRLVVIHPGASAPSRRYRPDGFAATANALINAGCDIIFSGDGSDLPLIAKIRDQVKVGQSYSAAGELTFEEFGALLQRADLLVSNNSGPVHLAAAVGTPVVDIYALTNPQHTPWGVRSRVLFHDVACKYCYKSVCPLGHNACLALISPEEVISAARELLFDEPRVPLSNGKSINSEANGGVYAWN